MGGCRRSSRDSAGSAGAFRNPGGRDRLAQCGDQRRQVFLIAPPALERGPIYRLAYFRQAPAPPPPPPAAGSQASPAPRPPTNIAPPPTPPPPTSTHVSLLP